MNSEGHIKVESNDGSLMENLSKLTQQDLKEIFSSDRFQQLVNKWQFQFEPLKTDRYQRCVGMSGDSSSSSEGQSALAHANPASPHLSTNCFCCGAHQPHCTSTTSTTTTSTVTGTSSIDEVPSVATKRGRNKIYVVRDNNELQIQPRRTQPLTYNKNRLVWKRALRTRFQKAITLLGARATAAKIVYCMNVEGLTRTHVGSHLQKYRQKMAKEFLQEPDEDEEDEDDGDEPARVQVSTFHHHNNIDFRNGYVRCRR